MTTWTFDGIPFTWLRQETNGVVTPAAWKRKPRLIVRPLLGSGDADIARVGYEPWAISGPILVNDANAAALTARDGSSALISDGVSTWTATAEISIQAMLGGGATGTATFTRARGA